MQRLWVIMNWVFIFKLTKARHHLSRIGWLHLSDGRNSKLSFWKIKEMHHVKKLIELTCSRQMRWCTLLDTFLQEIL